jgi:hypothetical protein
MPWTLLFAGAGVGVLAIIIDAIFLAPRNAKFRLYVMPLAVGMYLPFSVTTPLLLGGIVYWLVERNNKKRNLSHDAAQSAIHRGFPLLLRPRGRRSHHGHRHRRPGRGEVPDSAHPRMGQPRRDLTRVLRRAPLHDLDAPA